MSNKSLPWPSVAPDRLTFLMILELVYEERWLGQNFVKSVKLFCWSFPCIGVT